MPHNKYTTKLNGIRVLITGGSSGIGYGVAEALVEFNAAAIYISSSNQSRVDAAVEKLKSAYPDTKTKIQGLATNLGDQKSLEENVVKMFEGLDLGGEKLDHIVHTAGDNLALKSLQDLDMAFAVQAGMVRFFAPMMIAKHSVQYLKQSPDASITLTSGAISEVPRANWTAVAGYANGLFALTRQFALELKPVRVNLVSPGLVTSELWDGMSQEAREKMYEAAGKGNATGRVGKVEDLAECYLYLMRDGNTTGGCVSSNSGAFVVR